MKFQSGILGAIIVVIALMGTVFGGFFLNVNQSTVTVTDYDYVTDVSSLYSYTQQPDYIEYNPAKNFTGYQLSNGLSNGIDFSQSTTMNQYYMGSVDSATNTVDITSSMGTWASSRQYFVYKVIDGYGKCFETSSYGLATSIKTLDLTTLFTSLVASAPSNTTSLTISFPANSGLYIYDISTRSTATNPYLLSYGGAPSDGGTWNTYYGAFNCYNPSSMDDFKTSYYYNTNQITISYDLTGNPVSNYDSATIRFNNQYTNTVQLYKCLLVAQWDANVTTFNNITVPTSSVSYVSYDSIGLSTNHNVDVTYFHNPTYIYMQPSQGVSIDNTTPSLTTIWSNGKNNGEVKIVFGNNGFDCSNVLSFGNNTVSLKCESGTNYVKVDSGSWVNVGNWEHFLLDIDTISGLVKVNPITDFINYQNFTVADYTYTIGNISQNTFIQIVWNSTSSSFTFSVYSTKVHMTSNLIMVNPSLNITDYFPFTDGYRFSLGSFTVLGNSMTINGITMYGDQYGNPITQTGYLYYKDSNDNVFKCKLGNLMISVDGVTHHTYISDGSSIGELFDLGVTTTDVLSASGNWFFTTGLYEGHIANKNVYVWDWENNLTSTQSILIFLGLIIVSSLIARKFFNFTMLDIAVVVGASIILYAILGVF